jgi:hypothetical protein
MSDPDHDPGEESMIDLHESKPYDPTTVAFARMLTAAMQAQTMVELRYEDDPEPRLFAPHVLFLSVRGNLNVVGMQYRNPSQPLDFHKIRELSVERVTTLAPTGTMFRPSPEIKPDHSRYADTLAAIAA